jgi:hypothetical protein
MSRHEKWQRVLDAEARRWSAMSAERLIAELHDLRAYEIEVESEKYQVEVQLLEKTSAYVHVVVGVDDGSLPSSIAPLTHTFIRQKGDK